MLDIRLIRERPEEVKERLRRRGGDAWRLVARVLACDDKRRRAETEKQQLQSERNSSSKQIGILKRQSQDTSELETHMHAIGRRIKELEAESEAVAMELNGLLMGIPNLPHEGCPVGLDETANPEIKTWGEKPAIENPRNHVELASSLGLISFEDAIRIAGSGFVVYRGLGARLERALINFLLDTQTRENGYQEVGVPFIVKRECMEGTGQLPKFEDDMYGTEGQQMFLAPTAEVPVTNLYRDTIVMEAELPIKLTAYTPCFRREAGSAGRDNKGMIRIHQFDKVELVQILKPEDSFAELETLLSHAESILQKLGLHYRVIELCTGDLGFSSAKTYDIEVWAPGQGQYLEVSSCSCFTDYQARRMRLRCKDAGGRNRFCHTLNGSGTALPRLYVALLEQCQQPDGSVKLPAALVPYYGSDCIRPVAQHVERQ
ncbi:MAG: serine--tRNA ligase [Akkermansiaceae bacterium]|nr:serine--tRNA ligase [Akkermansiaceae bacterium]